MPTQLSCHSRRSFPRREVVDGADIVKTAARDVVTAGRVCACHHPRGPQRDGVHFVGGVCVPDDELAILRRGDEVSAICRPVHGIDFGEMAFEGALGLHRQPGQLFCALSRDIAHCIGVW